jgi:hypothetical protein
MKKVILIIASCFTILYCFAAQLPDVEQEKSQSMDSEAMRMIEVAQTDGAALKNIYARVSGLEKILNDEIAKLSRDYAQKNQELQILKNKNLTERNEDEIADTSSSVQNIEQQLIRRITQLKAMLDYLEELDFRLKANNNQTQA